MTTSNADARERVKNSPCEEPKANKDPESKRLQAARILVAQDKADGLCEGTDEDLDNKLLYISDCEAIDGNIDPVLEEIINPPKMEADSNDRNAA